MAYKVDVTEEAKGMAVKTKPIKLESIEVRKVPLFVEIIGEPSTGKTHLSSLFPKPALFDTTAKGESYSVVRKLYPSEWKQRYFRVREFKDIELHLKYITTRRGFFKTIIMDTSPDMRRLAAAECLKELQKAKPGRKALMPEEYKPVNTRINAFITRVTDPEGDFNMNLIFTAQMTDEWVARKSTGRRIRDGHKRANFQCDIRLYLQIKQKVDTKTMRKIPNEFERICRVVKCRFRNQVDKEDWITELKAKKVNEKGEVVQVDELNWNGIKRLAKLSEGEFVE